MCTDWMAPLYHMALVQQFWQWIAVTCLEGRSHEGELRNLFTRQRALSLPAMYSRSSGMNCKAYDERAKDATSQTVLKAAYLRLHQLTT